MLCIVCHSAVAKEIPLDDFLKHSDFVDMKLSPDGKHLAARLRENERIFMKVLELSTGAPVTGVNPGPFNEVRNYEWVSNDRLVYSFAQKHIENDRPMGTGEIFGINIDGSRSEILAGMRASDEKTGTRISNRESSWASFEIISLLDDDPKDILIAEHPWEKRGRVYYDTRQRNPVVSKMNVFNGRSSKVETVEIPGADLYAGRSGNINFATYLNEDSYLRSVFRADKEAPWQDIEEAFDFEASDIKVVGNSRKGDKVYLHARNPESGLDTIFELKPRDQTIRALFTDLEADIEDWVTDHNNEVVVGISFPAQAAYHYDAESDSKVMTLHKMLRNAFGGQTVAIENISNDGEIAVVHVSSAVNPGEYYQFNAQTKEAKFLAANYSWIDPRDMQPKIAVKTTASDGFELHGYLTMPKANNGSAKAPLVVLPHGGPLGVRDYPDFDWEVQLLANRGYAVLQPNFRGSGGYGHMFKIAGHREWGGKMIDDIIDATESVLASHSIDPDRVCIYGHSYGAYAAMMASVKAPTLYKCAIGSAGLYDLTTIEDSGVATLYRGGDAYVRRVVGTDEDALRAQSPLYVAHQLESELLIIHGRQDIVTPKSHYKSMTKALDKAGKQYQSLLISDAGHGPYNLENRQTQYAAVLKFLDQHIGN